MATRSAQAGDVPAPEAADDVAQLPVANQGILIAMNLLPLLMMYFLLSGLSLGLTILASKKSLYAFVMLLLPLILLPYVMFPAYMVFGSLDSLFNFRLYLQKKIDTKI